MRIGTKSVLFGVHQFALHPLIIALGWWKAYGVRSVRIGYALGPVEWGVYTTIFDPRLWLAFIVHDIGYLGKPNMDGPEGETHPEVGAAIMRRLFGEPWGELVLLHSRYYAKRLNRPVSPLCHADKWAIVLEPSWLYLPRVWLTGELQEFMALARKRGETMAGPSDPLTDEERAAFVSGSPIRWHRTVKAYMRRWLAAHQDGAPDTWTRVRHGAA